MQCAQCQPDQSCNGNGNRRQEHPAAAIVQTQASCGRDHRDPNWFVGSSFFKLLNGGCSEGLGIVRFYFIRDFGAWIMRRSVMKTCVLAGLMVLGGVAQAEAAPRCVYKWVAETKYRTVTEVVYEAINRNGRIVVVPRIVYKQVPYTTYRLVLDCGNPS